MLQNDTDLQTEITTHCPITFIRLKSITKVEKCFRAFSGGGIVIFGEGIFAPRRCQGETLAGLICSDRRSRHEDNVFELLVVATSNKDLF